MDLAIMNLSPGAIPSCVQTNVQLPIYPDGREPGPIFSITQDESKNLYYSDELNHKVVAMNAEGALRWMKGIGEPNFEPFRYPRGISLGWISRDGSLIRSLAVCDAWHHRVVFLDLEGNAVGTWQTAGELAFNDVSDVRFISLGEPSQGYWLVLDRGNHRICALGLDRHLIFQAGRGLPPALVPLWQASNVSTLSNGIQNFPTMLPFDPLFYPMRIFGNTEEAIFIWENSHAELKQLLAGNLFPVHLQSSSNHWLSADRWGLFGWCSEDHRVGQYDPEGNLRAEIPIEGKAIPSHGTPALFWTQSENKLTSYKLELPADATPPETEPYALLRRTSEFLIGRLEESRTEVSFNKFLENCTSYVNLSAEVLELYRSGKFSDAAVSALYARLHELGIECSRVFSSLACTLFECRLGMCILQLLAERGLAHRDISQATRDILRKVCRPFIKAFPLLAMQMDELFIAFSSLQTIFNRDEHRQMESLIGSLHQEINALVKQTYYWTRICCGNGCIDFPYWDRSVNYDQCLMNRNDLPNKHHRLNLQNTFSIKEVNRIDLQIAGEPIPKPYGVTRSPNGRFYVSLFSAGIIATFDPDGRSFEVPASLPSLSGPLGIEFDPHGRLWIVDSVRNEIVVWHPENREFCTFNSIQAENKPMASPVGICRAYDGAMLVADTGNHRVVKISYDGFCQILKSGEGTSPGEFRLPNSLCATRPKGGYWILDHRNHRVQHLDAAGNFDMQIGKCGLGRGELYVPESVVQFDDGMLVVSQGHLNRSLRLFSQIGEELGHLTIDYAPGGMLVWDNKLLVAQFDGSSIRIYERSH
jgi:hypothetical protein